MPLTFIANDLAQAGPDTALRSSALVRHLQVLDAALREREKALAKSRSRIAARLKVARAKMTARVRRGIEQRQSELIITAERRLDEIEGKLAPLAREIATTALREFLGTECAQPILLERLAAQVTAVLERLPNRFTTVRAHPNNCIAIPAGVQLVADETVPVGCAHISGRSGTITIDWRTTIERMSKP